MEKDSLITKTSRIIIPYSTPTHYTIPANKNRKWIKIMLNYMLNKNIGTLLLIRFGRKWINSEVDNFFSNFEGEGICIEISKRDLPYVIFEDKETYGKKCYKGSFNFCFYAYDYGINFVCIGFFED